MNDDESTLLKPFGGFDAKAFQMEMQCLFGLQSRPMDEEVLESIKRSNRMFPRWQATFIEALKALVLHPSISFSKKGDLYLDDYLTDEEAEEHFRRIWKLIAPNEPWPIETRKL